MSYERIVYVDINNNIYKISGNVLTYKPVSPTKSSTGHYDGGSFTRVSLDRDALKKLSELADKLLKDTTNHAPVREKFDAVLVLTRNRKQTRLFLKNASARQKWEACLRMLIKRPENL